MSISMRRTVERSTPSNSASLAIFFTDLAARRTGTTCLLPVRGRPRLRRLGIDLTYTENPGKIGARDGCAILLARRMPTVADLRRRALRSLIPHRGRAWFCKPILARPRTMPFVRTIRPLLRTDRPSQTVPPAACPHQRTPIAPSWPPRIIAVTSEIRIGQRQPRPSPRGPTAASISRGAGLPCPARAGRRPHHSPGQPTTSVSVRRQRPPRRTAPPAASKLGVKISIPISTPSFDAKI